jgi:UDP-N-acetylmuramate--alanine ligase
MKDKWVYFLGIGGIGMSALARYFMASGFRVAGYDKARTPLTEELENEGALVHYEDNISRIPAEALAHPDTLYIYTPAISSDHSELLFLRKEGKVLVKRAEVLGRITETSTNFSIAGTHGKTTVTTMLSHLLYQAGWEMSGFMGGISANYQSNFISRGSKYSVTEADEYDRSFLQLSPNFAVITSVDADHLDIYGEVAAVVSGFKAFGEKVRNGGKLIVKHGLPVEADYTYGFDGRADFHLKKLEYQGLEMTFEFWAMGEKYANISLQMPGTHNAENACAALALAYLGGLSGKDMESAFKNFKGVKRRFEVVVNNENGILIDDYAHHPSELQAIIGSVRNHFPDSRIVGVFQPHLFSRTRDFMEEFAEVLAELDYCYLLPIYPARELPIPGIGSEQIAKLMPAAQVEVVEKEAMMEALSGASFDILLMLGAGDIDMLVKPVAREIFGVS